jgi:purine-binding chemotaxis protein CheW
METTQYLCCQIGREWYGLPVDRVIEVLHFLALNEIPGTSPDVLGLLTLREQVMPVVDLRLRFGLPQAELDLDTPLIAIRTAQGPMGIVVDDVDDVVKISGETEQITHESPYTTRLVRLDDRLLLLIDVDHLRDPIGMTAG